MISCPSKNINPIHNEILKALVLKVVTRSYKTLKIEKICKTLFYIQICETQ